MQALCNVGIHELGISILGICVLGICVLGIMLLSRQNRVKRSERDGGCRGEEPLCTLEKNSNLP